MNIAVSSNKLFLKPLSVLLYSLYKHNENVDVFFINFSVEDSDLSATETAKAYCEYLKLEGFSLKDKSENYRMYYRVISNPDLRLEGHFDIEIWFDDEEGEVKVEYSIDDSPYED